MELAEEGNDCIPVAVKHGYFFDDEDGWKFDIFFNDLYDFFQLVSIGSSILRCWTLYMMTQAKLNDPIPMRFLDAYVVSAAFIGSQRDSAIEYVTKTLQDQRTKDHVMFAYAHGNHWIMIVVALRHSKAYYLDSLQSRRRDFTPIREVLDHVFIRTKGSRLKHIVNVPCHQQPCSSELCGFYTMYHMKLVAAFVKKNGVFRGWKCSLKELKIERIEEMLEDVAIFIDGQVINPDGDFHVVAKHKREKGSPATETPHSSYDFFRGGQSNTTNNNVRSFSDDSDNEDDIHSTFTRLEVGGNAKKSKVDEGGVKMANIKKGSRRPPIDHKFQEAVRNDEADSFRKLLSLPEPPTTAAHHQIQIPDEVASNNDGATGEGVMTSNGLVGSNSSDGAGSSAAGTVPLPPQSELLLRLRGVTSDGDGVLHIAARSESVKVVREIPGSWSDAVNVAAGNNSGETALHCAAATGNVDMINLLLSLATDDGKKRQLLRMQKQSGETCLHDAVRFGKMDAVKILVQEDVRIVLRPNDRHALVTIHDNKDVSPLHLATDLRQVKIAEFLTDKQENAASCCVPLSKIALHAAVLLSKVTRGGVKMANIQEQSSRPLMDDQFLEAVKNNEADNFRRLLNLPEPPRTAAHHVIQIRHKVASNNDGATGDGVMTSKALDGSNSSDGAGPSAARTGTVPLPPQSELFLGLRGVTSDGDGVLHIAARLERVKVVREIPGSWSDAVNVAAGNNRGETALHYAAATGNVDMIRLLLSLATDNDKKRQLLRMKKQSGETCLHDAVRFGKMDAVKILVQEDVRIVVRPNDRHALVRIHDNEGVSPLYLATTLRQVEIVKFLTDKQESDGVQYPAASYYGPGSKTALHAAVLFSKDLSEHLAKWKKELIEEADESGSTPLHLLASTSYKTVVPFSLTDHSSPIIDSLVSTMIRIFVWFFPTAQVSRLRNMEIVIMELLLEMDETAGYREDDEGSLPIHVAAANGNLDVVKLLSKCRPYCSWSCNNLGQTILHIAVRNGRSNVVDYVCSRQKFVQIFNTRDSNGNTALHLAVLEGDQVIFCRLVRMREVCLTFTNKEERTPLDLAQLSLPSGIALLKGPRRWIMCGLVAAGADYGTCRSDHLASKVEKPDKDKESETISKSAALVAACAVLILTTAFAAPFTVTNYYNKSTEKFTLRRVAYSIFVISDVLAFGLSAVTICFATFSGFPFLHRGTRLFYLPTGVLTLGLAALSLIFVFTAGFYVTVSPLVHIRVYIIAPLLASAAALATSVLLSAPFVMAFLHMRVVLSKVGLRVVCRRALVGALLLWLLSNAYALFPVFVLVFVLVAAAWQKAPDSRLDRHLQSQQRRAGFTHDGGIGRLHATLHNS